MPEFRTAYGESFRQIFETTGPSATHQASKAECDVNTIMAKYQKTGVLEHRNSFEGQYADFTDTPADYQESLNAVLLADEMFASLPSTMRRRFHNDAAAFIEFVGNPDNAETLVELGLAHAPKAAPEAQPASPAPKAKEKPTPPSAAPKSSDED